jgi:hypothetical protein
MAANKPRVGYRMRELQAIVSYTPGISKAAALRAAGLPDRGLGYWRPIERTVAAGLVIADRDCPWVRKPAHALFASERDRTWFYLRQELLHGNPTPERATQILAEIEDLQAVRVASWVS